MPDQTGIGVKTMNFKGDWIDLEYTMPIDFNGTVPQDISTQVETFTIKTFVTKNKNLFN